MLSSVAHPQCAVCSAEHQSSALVANSHCAAVLLKISSCLNHVDLRILSAAVLSGAEEEILLFVWRTRC